MGSSTVICVVAIGVILAIIGPQACHILRIQGYHKATVKNIHPGKCWNIPGIDNGAEDMELLPGGRVLATAGLRWPPDNPMNPDTRGRVLLIDLNQSEPEPVEVAIKGDLDLTTFNPLGMTKWINKKLDKITILIINLSVSPLRASVERFVYSESDNTLHHVETLGLDDPNFYVLDDIAAVGERKFYFSNILGEHAHWEWKFLLPWQSFGYFDGSKSVIVDDGLCGPNGIHISPDRKYVYGAVSFEELIKTYKRKEDNSLEHVQDYPVPFIPDNFMVADNGDLWVSGPKVGYKCFNYMHDPHHVDNPTQVMRLTMKEGMVTSSSTVFVDDGDLHSAGSIAIPYKNKILLGSVMTKVTICTVDEL